MADLRIDPTTGDLDISNNKLQITNEGLDSIAQRLRIRLRFFFREWVLDRSQGTMWFEKVLRKNTDKFVADQEIRKRILDTYQVSSIQSFESSIDASTRSYSVTCTVRTTLGKAITFQFSDIANTYSS